MIAVTKRRIPRGRPKAQRAEHRLADAAIPEFRTAFDAHRARLARAFGPRKTALALSFEAVEQAVHLADWTQLENQLSRALIRPTMRLVRAAGQLHQALIPKSRIVKQADPLGDLGFRFDLTNPRSLRWIEAHVANLVVGITQQEREAIRQVILRMFQEGIPVQRGARMIREIVGLDLRSANAVTNFEIDLTRRGFAPERIDQFTARYSKRLHRARSLRIARTETITAAAQGQQELWLQAADQGLLERDRTRRRWIVTPDERLCEICAPIPSQGDAPLDESFPSGHFQPPAHVACRCAIRLVFTNEEGEFPASPKPATVGTQPPRTLRPKIPKR